MIRGFVARLGGGPAVLVATATAAALFSGCGSEGNGDGGATPGDGGPNAVFACALMPTLKELTLPMSEVAGVLRGASHNPSTTCTRQKGTGGPETFYGLRIAERTVVDLEVVSDLDTVVAIRKTCDDAVSEIACADDPLSTMNVPIADGGVMPVPPPLFDAGGPGAGSSGRDGHLRTALDPGLYYVLIDEAAPFGVGGDFVLRVSATAPPAEANCQGAVAIMDGTTLAAEPLAFAIEKGPACAGSAAMPALFYQAQIPSGQKLTLRVPAISGDRVWDPVIQVFKNCGAGVQCLATGRSSSFGDKVVRYINNGPTTETVTIAVSADVAVKNAAFSLTASIADPVTNLTCAGALALTDGQSLRNQDLTEALPSTDVRCGFGGQATLYYQATLLPVQTLTVRVTGRTTTGSLSIPPLILIREGCDDTSCNMPFKGGDVITYTNPGPAAKTIILSASAFPGSGVTALDLSVAIPPPPGGVDVSPVNGLTTTESGGQATFAVVLTAPPLSNVVVPLASSNVKEGTVSPASLTFTPDNWRTPQTVTVTGVDDDVSDGDQPYTIQVRPAVSAQKEYSGIDGPDVAVVNRDNEPGFFIAAPAVLLTGEAGAQARFTVTLNRAPTAPVHVALSSSNTAEGTVAPAELVFDAASWDKPQTVTVTGVDDSVQDGAQAYKIHVGPVTSDDARYAALAVVDRDARNADDEFAAVAARTVSGGMFCVNVFHDGLIGADQTGIIYAAMACQPSFGGGSFDAGFPASSGGGAPAFDGGPIPPPGGAMPMIPSQPMVFVASSSDGGKTFGAPVNTGLPSTDFHIVGAGAGSAVLVALSAQGTLLTRTSNSGASWQAPQRLSALSNAALLASLGNRVAVLLPSDQGDGLVLWTSDDGAANLTPTMVDRTSMFQPTSIGLGAEPGTVWLAGFDSNSALTLRKSTDNGKTFGDGQQVTATGVGLPARQALTTRTFFAVDEKPPNPQAAGQMLVAPLANLAAASVVTGFSSNGGPAALIADSADNVTVLGYQAAAVSAFRLPAGGATFGAPRMIDFSDGPPSGTALSPHAVAVQTTSGNQVRVSVQTW